MNIDIVVFAIKDMLSKHIERRRITTFFLDESCVISVDNSLNWICRILHTEKGRCICFPSDNYLSHKCVEVKNMEELSLCSDSLLSALYLSINQSK